MEEIEVGRIKSMLKQKSTEELLKIWTENKENEWPDGTFKILKTMLKDKGIKLPKQKKVNISLESKFDITIENIDFSKEPECPFFVISIKKLIIMTMFTFGIYEVVWFYKNWKLLKEKYSLDIKPFWRTVFAPIFCYSLFKIIKNNAVDNQIKVGYKPGTLVGLYILLPVVGRMIPNMDFLSLLILIPIIIVQGVVNKIQEQFFHGTSMNNQFTFWNIIFIILGMIGWISIIIDSI